MLEWNEIRGYDYEFDYKYQNNVLLPDLNEEVLFQYTNEVRPNRPPFVGYFKQYENGSVWLIVSANEGSLCQVQDGIKWARFNRA